MTLHPIWEQGAGPSQGAQDQVLGLFFHSSILMDMCLISDTPVPVLMTDRPQGADHDLSARPRLGVQPPALLPTGYPASHYVWVLIGSSVLFRAGGLAGPLVPLTLA